MANGNNNNTTSSIPNLKCGNPYSTLNLPNFATPSQIKKAFRNLSLKLHPDKRSKDLSPKQHEEYDKQFQLVQEAKSFLLDVEHTLQKEKYDQKLRSDELREVEEKRREEAMSGSRKKMKNDLQDKIQRELEKQRMKTNNNNNNNNEYSNENIDGLKEAGKRMRDEYIQKQQSQQYKDLTKSHKKQKQSIQYRQIRLKWSRSKIGGQSDDMIAKLLSEQFGDVEDVELIGRKGNAALVTFVNSDSCKLCVDAYLNSDTMRATYVGKRKDEEGGISDDGESMMNRERDRESVEERKLRQEAEREKILRQMEMEENEEMEHEKSDMRSRSSYQKMKSSTSASSTATKPKSLFPPMFPATGKGQQQSYLERLEEMERIVLKDLIPPDVLKAAQILKPVD